jgi:hypothetical protein
MNQLRKWLQANVDFALILAIFTETPRWTVAFMAVHEPLWVGIPLGVLLAFATSHAWRAYFATRHAGLLAFNIASILIAVAVIAPVLFAMIYHPATAINIAEVLPVQLAWGWAALLAVTTFLPLVQLAAVQGLHTRMATVQPGTATAQSESAAMQPEVADIAGIAVLPLAEQARNMANEGMTIADIARQLQKSPRTISNYLRAQRNGSAYHA